MSKTCEISGKGGLVGNNVSHANNRTKRKFDVNLQIYRSRIESLNRLIRLKISVASIRTIDKKGGFENFLLSTTDSKLSKRLRKLKTEIIAKKQKSAKHFG